MEVTLLDSTGLPKGCLLSIRAGTTRRQAPAEPEKFKLCFPKGVQHAEPFKVDVLAPKGSVAVELVPEKELYDIVIPTAEGEPPMQVTLRVHDAATAAHGDAPPMQEKGAGVVLPLPLKEDGAPRDPESAGRRHRVAVSARRYLDEHSLLTWTQNLFQDMIREQPSDPWAFIDDRTRQARASREEGDAKGPAAPPPPAVDEAEESAKSAPPPEEEAPPPEAASPPEGEAEESAKSAPPPEEEAPETDEPPPAAPPLPGAEEESEAKATMEAPEPEEPAPSSPPPGGEEDEGADKATLPGDEEEPVGTDTEIQALKDKAKDALWKAFDLVEDAGDDEAPPPPPDGEQHETDQGAAEEEAHKSAAPAASEASSGREVSPDELRDLRIAARGSLLRAAVSGQLDLALREAQAEAARAQQDQEVDFLRSKAREALTSAAFDGLLATALKEAREDQPPERGLDELRVLARDALERDSDEGRLSGRLEAPDPEELRGRVQEVLDKAATDGRLGEMLGGSRPNTAEVDKLRDEARTLLAAACSDGRLGAALLRIHEEEEDEEVEALRNQARVTLAEATKSGRLEALLRTGVPIDEHHEELLHLREQIRVTLESAANDGRLSESLRMVKPEDEVAADEDGPPPELPSSDLLEAAAAAHAAELEEEQDIKDRTSLMMARLDSDKDGKLTLEELQEGLRLGLCQTTILAADGSVDAPALMELLDTDKDGKLDMMELHAGLTSGLLTEPDLEELREQARLAMVGALENGQLFRALATAKGVMDKLDLNDDGGLDADELERALRQGSLQVQGAATTGEEALRILDRDGDGHVSLLELHTAFDQGMAKDLSEGGHDVEKLREQARDALVSALDDGNLLRALASAKGLMITFDNDNDGVLSMEELQQGLVRGALEVGGAGLDAEAAMKQLDLDGDGVVSFEELYVAVREGTAAEGKAATVMRELDTNHDGSLSVEEIQQALDGGTFEVAGAGHDAAEAMRLLDADGDGKVSMEELHHALVAQEAPPPLEPSATGKAATMMRELDTNHDGSLSMDEIQQALDGGTFEVAGAGHDAAEAMRVLDADGDGKVSMEELQQALVAQEEQEGAKACVKVPDYVVEVREATEDAEQAIEEAEDALREAKKAADAQEAEEEEAPPPPPAQADEADADATAKAAPQGADEENEIEAIEAGGEDGARVAPGDKVGEEEEGDEDTVEVIQVSMTVENVDYDKMASDPAFVASFTSKVKETLLAELGGGIAPEDMHVQLFAGSVIVKVNVVPRNLAALEGAREALGTSPPASLGDRLVSNVTSLEFIETIATGPVVVSGVGVENKQTDRAAWEDFQSKAPQGAAEGLPVFELPQKIRQQVPDDNCTTNSWLVEDATTKAPAPTEVTAVEPLAEGGAGPSSGSWVVEDVKDQTGLPALSTGTGTAYHIGDATRSQSLSPPPSTKGLTGDTLMELEKRIHARNERFRRENEVLRQENARLKGLREFGEETRRLGEENLRLRGELGGRSKARGGPSAD